MIWRVGRKVGRTLYLQQEWEPQDGDQLIGVMDTPELAEKVVQAVNSTGMVPGPDDSEFAHDEFRSELQQLINRHSVDSALNTPDFILAEYMIDALGELRGMLAARDKWGKVPLYVAGGETDEDG